MAQKIQTLLIDGSAAEGTVRFGLGGAEYEIDLNPGHARQLRDALARYVDAEPPMSASGARAHGIEVKDRGRGAR